MDDNFGFKKKRFSRSPLEDNFKRVFITGLTDVALGACIGLIGLVLFLALVSS